LVLMPNATRPCFEPNIILNDRGFRQSEGHIIINIDGKSVLLNELSHNCNKKYINNSNRNIFKWPIFADILPYLSGGIWDFHSSGGVLE